jgi:hypothetical protein
MKPTKNCLRGGGHERGFRKNIRGNKFDQSTLYAYMEISQ